MTASVPEDRDVRPATLQNRRKRLRLIVRSDPISRARTDEYGDFTKIADDGWISFVTSVQRAWRNFDRRPAWVSVCFLNRAVAVATLASALSLVQAKAAQPDHLLLRRSFHAPPVA